MSASHLENAQFALFCRYLPHNHRVLRRLAAVCSAAQLAKSTRLSHLARCLPQATQQASRVRFLSRFFQAELFRDDTIYRLLLQQALTRFRTPIWHLVIDRTNWIPKKQDILMLSLSYHKRAIPLVWQLQPFGASSGQAQITLLEKTRSFLPKNQPILLHGDAEFGSVPLLRYVSQRAGWQFILGQSRSTMLHFGDCQWQPAHTLKVSPSRPFSAANIFLTKQHHFGPLNFFAFYKPYRSGPHEPTKSVRYLATSLPIAPQLSRLGQRRWGCEPMFRDFKSSGWHIADSVLPDPASRHALLLLLAINYLWAVSLGRWLVKSSRRHHIDCKKNDIIASFVLAKIG